MKGRFKNWQGLLASYQVSLEDAEHDTFYAEADNVAMHFHPGSRVHVRGDSSQQVVEHTVVPLYNKCFCLQESCPSIELSLLRSTVAVKSNGGFPIY